MRRALLVLGAWALACVNQTIDLRGQHAPSTEQSCPPGEGIDPQTGDCAPCEPLAPHPALVCPCDFVLEPAPYPLCEAYTCLPCRGDITACSAYNPATGNAYNCDLLLQCCSELAQDEGSLACCPAGAQVVCAASENLGEYAFTCQTSTCCAGTPCPNGDSDCAAWQSCDTNAKRCTPACHPEMEYCCSDCGCTCQPVESPPI